MKVIIALQYEKGALLLKSAAAQPLIELILPINSAMNSRQMKFTLLKLLQMYKNVWYQLALSRGFNSKDQTLKSIQQVNKRNVKNSFYL